MEPVIVALIVAAGRGTRMQDGDGPKQYRQLGGKAVVSHCLAVFLDHPRVTHAQVVIHPDDHAVYAGCITPRKNLLAPVNGGKTRQQSVYSGLEAIGSLEPSIVLIHDAARPFVSAATIDRLIEATVPGTSALPAHRVVDTLKKSEDGAMVAGTVDRDGLWAAQTPQCFVYCEILDAHRRFSGTEHEGRFTDDAAIAEAAGIKVRLIEVPASNFKITTENDMQRAEQMLSRKSADIRTGNGYDVHRTGSGDNVTLCGVTIPCDISLIGHSDADVGLHALTDALLATVSAGDIGSHFPPDDEQWKDAASSRFLDHAARLVREAGGRINHLDVTLICETPKIGPHRDAMRARIAEICEISADRISVKATTNETIGFIGRGEGIAAIANATVCIMHANESNGDETG